MKMYTRLKTCILIHVKKELSILLDVSDVTVLFLEHLNRLWLEHCEQLVRFYSQVGRVHTVIIQ